MNSKTLQTLQHFVGKVCSIFVPATNRNFTELLAREHFVVRVQEITVDGIWGTHPANNLVSFFAMPHIMSIIEEAELDPNNPEHAQMIKEFEQRSGQKLESDIKPISPQIMEASKQKAPQEVPFVDIRNLEVVAQQAQDAVKQQAEIQLRKQSRLQK